MKFLAGHPYLTVFCLITGAALWQALKSLGSRPAFQTIWLHKATPFVLLLLLAAFWWRGYWTPTTYYHPGNIGVLGDNYSYMGSTLENPSYFNAQHLYFPWVAGQWVKFLSDRGILNPANQDYVRQAFVQAAVPTKLLTLLSFLAIGFTLRRVGWSRVDAALATLLYASTAGIWLWGHQLNAMGAALACQAMTLCAYWIWLKKPGWFSTAILSAMAALCLYAHAAAIFFTFSCALSVFWIELFRARSNGRWVRLGIYAFVSLALAVMYYPLAAARAGSQDPQAIFNAIADVPYFGEFVFHFSDLPRLIKDNGVSGMVNLLNYWDPQNARDRALTALLFLTLVAWFSALAGSPRALIKDFRSGFNHLILLASIFTFAVFLTRNSAMYYYAVATVPNMWLLIVWGKARIEESKETAFALRSVWALMILALILYSSLSTRSVLLGSRWEDNEFIRVLRHLQNNPRTSDQPPVYFTSQTIRYETNAVRHYYGHNPKAKVLWCTRPDVWSEPSDLLAQTLYHLNRGALVLMDEESAALLPSAIAQRVAIIRRP